MRLPALAVASFFALLSAIAPSARSEVIFQPAAVTTNMGGDSTGGTYDVNYLIDQSGLSANYTSGVTDFATYTASTTADNSERKVAWFSSGGPTTGNVDFSLGGSYTIDSIAIWNFLPSDTSSLKDFTLIASNDSSFASYTTLGSFSATAPGDSLTSIPAETFSFAATTASYVRMEITSNFGSAFFTGFGEAAFGGLAPASVPEPSSLALCGVAVLIGLAANRLRRERIA